MLFCKRKKKKEQDTRKLSKVNYLKIMIKKFNRK